MIITSAKGKLWVIAAGAALILALAASPAAAAKPRPTHAAPNVSFPASELREGSAAQRSAKAGKYVEGARSLGDPLFPQIGNGGYDVRRYRINLDYDPGANEFNRGTFTRIVARANESLREFSLDFQDLDVTSVTVNGKRAKFAQEEATPDLSDIPEVTQPMKLIVTPHGNARPREGERFVVNVRYQGQPEHITDPDESIEGWIRACYPLDEPRTCDGSFVVNEPIGAQSWFPSNNYPTDKARFRTLVTVPDGKTAFGVGELLSMNQNGDGTRTWRWREDDPTATYLTTATVGDFDNSFTQMAETTTGRSLDVYNAIDSSATPAQMDAINASLARAPEQLNFLSNLLGPYPFDSIGAVADRAAGVGYALEVQTNPHYSGGFVSGNPSINITTQLHEIAHQWMGNSVSPATWLEIWFNEGWATWLEWHWEFESGESTVSPADQFDANYNDPGFDWSVAPAVLEWRPRQPLPPRSHLPAVRLDAGGLPADRRRRALLRARPHAAGRARVRQHQLGAVHRPRARDLRLRGRRARSPRRLLPPVAARPAPAYDHPSRLLRTGRLLAADIERTNGPHIGAQSHLVAASGPASRPGAICRLACAIRKVLASSGPGARILRT
jgi:Peptidase family M1 domain/Peptidase M1 N-terminal domain